MKILIIADEESKYLWDYYDSTLFTEIDFIISAGDLKAKYLSFLTTMSSKRLFYVHGNHDTRYIQSPPHGCDTLEDHIIVQNGIRILGLGGSFRYKKGHFQYTEKQMRRRIKKLNTIIRQFGGIDIIVTHAPAKGIDDSKDLCHTGFEVFNELMDKYKPSYLIHGHQHLNYGYKSKRIHFYKETTIINGYNYYILDYVKNDAPPIKFNMISRFMNTVFFYIKFINSQISKEYSKYKRYLKNNNL